MDPIWQPTESIPFMKPTLHVNQTKLMAMMSPKWDPSASILWGPLPSLLTHAHEVDDKHMTSHLFLFLLLSTITVYSQHRRQPNNHIYLDQLLEAISWRPTNHYILRRWSIIDNIFPAINNKMSPQPL